MQRETGKPSRGKEGARWFNRSTGSCKCLSRSSRRPGSPRHPPRHGETSGVAKEGSPCRQHLPKHRRLDGTLGVVFVEDKGAGLCRWGARHIMRMRNTLAFLSCCAWHFSLPFTSLGATFIHVFMSLHQYCINLSVLLHR